MGQEGEKWDIVELPAIAEKDGDEIHRNVGDALWPERWDYDALIQRKTEVGSLIFTREYMCIPISTGTSLFNPEHLTACKELGKKEILRKKEILKKKERERKRLERIRL